MMSFEGMDPDQVEQHGHQLLTESGNIEHLISMITTHVSTLASNWRGQDSEQFQHEWSTSYIQQMQNAQKALHSLGQIALNNAHDQRQTSGRL